MATKRYTRDMNKHLLLAVPILAAIIFLVSRQIPVVMPEEQVDTSTPELVAEETFAPLTVEFSPSYVQQGDPTRIVVKNLTGTTTVSSIAFNGKRLGVFRENNNYSALLGIDLKMATGKYPVVATLSDGTQIEQTLTVSPRQIVQAPLGIPESLGGNTPESEKTLVNTLVQEGAIISAVPSASEKLWSGTFRLPINPPIVITDTYGYSRLTGGSSISHKGTDFRAAVGTPVFAMNSGTVRFAQSLRNYGNTIIVDHGLGLHTIYMHLSKIEVPLNKNVTKGELIGLSGDTGYVLGPHLHLTIRINGISIDPEKFMEMLGD